jgi:uncharacterized protein (DUF1015 family)
VFLTFRDNQEAIKERIEMVAQNEPWGDVKCDDGVQHILWRCSDEDSEFF